MLSPSLAFAPTIATAVFVALVIVLVFRAVRKDRKEYGRFKRYRSTARRQTLYRKWLVESFLLFGGSALAVLILSWQFIPLFFADFEALPAVVEVRSAIADGGDLVAGFAIGATVTIVIGSILAIFLARNSESIPAIGDIAALLPRNRAELRYGVLLAVNAGVVEELLFRLALPLLLYAATGSASVAIIASVALFGLLHLYQGVWGVVGSVVIGAVLMALYLATGSILAPIIVHALIDLRSLVLIPVIVFGVHKKSGAASHMPTATR